MFDWRPLYRVHGVTLIALSVVSAACQAPEPTSGLHQLPAQPVVALESGDQPRTALELIPDNAAIAIAVEDFQSFVAKGDRLVEAGALPSGFRLSTAFSLIFAQLNIANGRDDTLPSAFMLGEIGVITASGFAALNQIAERVIYAVGVSDPSPLLERLDPADAERARRGEIVSGGSNAVVLSRRHLIVGGPIFGSGGNVRLAEANVRRTLAGPSVAQTLGNDAPRGDLLIYLKPHSWGSEWDSIKRSLIRTGSDDAYGIVMRQLGQTADESRYVAGGISLDKGLDVELNWRFRTGGNAETFLDTLSAGGGTSTLRGLPNTPPVAAFAARGDGAKNRKLLDGLLAGLAGDDPVAARFRTLLTGLWGNLNGSRGGLWFDTEGAPTVVLVLDVDDVSAVPKIIQSTLASWGDGAPATYTAAAETLAGVGVDHIALTPTAAPGMAEALRLLRVATHKGKVILHAGPNHSLLSDTLKLITEDAPGLAENRLVTAALAPLRADPQVLVVASMARIGGSDSSAPPERYSAFSLAARSDQLRFDAWLPAQELSILR